MGTRFHRNESILRLPVTNTKPTLPCCQKWERISSKRLEITILPFIITCIDHEANRRTEIKITGIKDLSPEEEAILEANKSGFRQDENLKDCEQVDLKPIK